MVYRIELLPAAESDLASLPAKIQRQISNKIGTLATKPRRPDCKLRGDPQGRYKIRSGDYRIVYRIEDDRVLVIVVRIGHRKDIYRFLDREQPPRRRPHSAQ